MTRWLLLYWIVTGSSGSFGGLHNSTAVAEFDSEAACKAAYAAMRAVTKDRDQMGVFGVCVSQAADAR
jgi:hypothetical protein